MALFRHRRIGRFVALTAATLVLAGFASASASTATTAPGGFVFRDRHFGPDFTRLRDVPGSQVTAHLGINNRGQVAGVYIADDAVPSPDGQFDTAHGFVQDRRGATKTFDVPGATITGPGGLNDRGDVAGFWVKADDSVAGFVRSRRGHIETFEVPFFHLHNVSDINNRGEIIGYYDDPGFAGEGAFLRDRDGTFTDIRYPGASYTFVHGINDHGRIVGTYLEPGASPNPDGTVPRNTVHGFVWEDGRFTSFDVRGSVYTQAFGINDRGDIVGGYYDASGRQHGFLHHRGRDRTLDVPNGKGNIATGIDDHRRIVLPDSRAVALIPLAP
jgi:probable HAF family extracellular repeat protein